MAYGTELIMALPVTAANDIATRLGVDLPVIDLKLDDWRDEIDALTQALQPTLSDTHLALVREHIDPNASKTPPAGSMMEQMSREFDNLNDRYVYANTAKGPRQLAPFCFEIHYDPYEVGDREEDAIAGIGLDSRYYPCFVDWEHTHGGSGGLTDMGTPLVQAARDAIVAAVPEFADAKLIVKMKHY